jgi:hypothetical protein
MDLYLAKPSDVVVDRETEWRWIKEINDSLAEPWGPSEIKRRIELKGKMSEVGGLARWIADRYTKAGWFVTTNSGASAPDQFVELTFSRPGTEANDKERECRIERKGTE